MSLIQACARAGVYHSNPARKPSHSSSVKKQGDTAGGSLSKQPSTARASSKQDSSKEARQGGFCNSYLIRWSYRKCYGCCLALSPASNSSQHHIRGTRGTMHEQQHGRGCSEARSLLSQEVKVRGCPWGGTAPDKTHRCQCTYSGSGQSYAALQLANSEVCWP